MNMAEPFRPNCPIQKATDVFADQWSFLIFRELNLEGPRKFKDFQDDLGISPNTLSTKLKKLEEAGIVERHIYSDRPPRAEYRLTEHGTSFRPVMAALRTWGNTL